jgi:YgiT-type zinc finger domain-containing protein
MEDELMQWLQEWWEAHPQASLSEMETALDGRMAEMRVRVLEGALAGGGRGEKSRGAREREEQQCPVCGTEMVRSGRRKRQLKTRGNQELVLERDYMRCPRCGAGIFPPRP